MLSPGAEGGCGNVDGVEIVYLRCRAPQPWAYIEFQLRALLTLLRRRRRRNSSTFTANRSSRCPPGSWLARSCSVTTTSSFRGGRASPLYRPYRQLLRAFDLLLPVSEYCRTESARLWRLPPERMTVSYCGVNAEEFRPDKSAGRTEREALDVTGPIILYVGRICRQKGTDTLLTAYREVQASRPDVKLVLVGPFEQFEARDSGSDDTWRRRIRAVDALYPRCRP